MADRPTMTPADVPQTLVDAAEQALAAAYAAPVPDYPDMTPTEAVRVILAATLPAHADQLGAELGRLTVDCARHPAPSYALDCITCARHAALIGARRVVEGRNRASSGFWQFRQTITPEGTAS